MNMTVSWKYYLAGIAFVLFAATMLIGKLFFEWPIDTIAVFLFLIIWLPAIVPFLRRMKYKDIEVEFIEQSVKAVQFDLANLANESEVEKEQSRGIVKTAPRDIRVRHSSDKIDDKYFRVRVWLDAPDDFMGLVDSVRYERHPTFRNRYKVVANKPFEDIFKCWGEFTIKAQIKLKSGETLLRQRYLSLTAEENNSNKSGDTIPI